MTKGIVNAEVIGKLKPGAFVINTARADVMDYKALAQAVKEKGIKVGLDVYPGEPAAATGDFTTPLFGMPGVYGTHHIGASTDQAQEAIAGETVRIVKTFKDTGARAERREPGEEVNRQVLDDRAAQRPARRGRVHLLEARAGRASTRTRSRTSSSRRARRRSRGSTSTRRRRPTSSSR